MKFFMTVPNNAVEAMLKRNGHTLVKQWYEKHDITLFPGGLDITPFLYGERMMKNTKTDFRRDILENRIFRSLPVTAPKVGICRGAQLLHVLSGGSLFQDVNNHGKEHDVYDLEHKRFYRVTSTHHQMMRSHKGARVLAGTNMSSHKECEAHVVNSGNSSRAKTDVEDIEVAYWESTNSLCFQPHPEYNVKECETYFFRLVDSYFGTAEVHVG